MPIPTQIQATNPAAGFAEGVQSGNDWAIKSANVGLQMQQLQQQQQQHAEMKRQFNIGVGKTLNEMLQDAVSELPGPVKKSKIEGIKAFGEQSGIKIDPSQLASLGDENYQPKYSEFFKAMGAANPEAADHFFAGFGEHLGRKASMEMLEKATTAIGMMNSAKARTASMDNRVEEQSQVNAQGQAMKAMAQFQPRLEGASRIAEMWKKVDSGKIKNNSGLKSLINSEIQRLETGASNPAFEAQQQKEMGSTAEKLKQILPGITGEQTDSVPPGVTKQLKELSGTLSTAYMDQADSAFDILKAGARPDQAEIFQKKHEALQASYRKRFGFWGSEEQQKLQSQQKPSKPDNSVTAKANQYRGMINTAKNDADKQALINSAKKVLPPEAWDASWGK